MWCIAECPNGTYSDCCRMTCQGKPFFPPVTPLCDARVPFFLCSCGVALCQHIPRALPAAALCSVTDGSAPPTTHPCLCASVICTNTDQLCDEAAFPFCFVPMCGNGKLEYGEECDNNTSPASGDGCSDTCKVESMPSHLRPCHLIKGVKCW